MSALLSVQDVSVRFGRFVALDSAKLHAVLAHDTCPTSVEGREALPRNPSGKLLKPELREPYRRGYARRIH